MIRDVDALAVCVCLDIKAFHDQLLSFT